MLSLVPLIAAFTMVGLLVSASCTGFPTAWDARISNRNRILP